MEFSWEKLVISIKKYKSVILSTIIKRRGSAPRGVNTSMIILPHGDIIGTIGGGPVENEIIKESLRLIKTQKNQITTKTFTGDSVICGGEITVLEEYISEKDLSFFENIVLQYNEKDIFLVRFLENFERKIFYNEQDIEKLVNKNIYVQKIKSIPELFIFGAGHIALPLAQMAYLCDFNIIVLDDREDFINKKRFPDAQKCIHCNFNNILSEISLKNNSFIVLVTREHSHDEILLKQLLGKPYKYLGMIGSRKRVGSVKDRLINQGFDKNEVDRIFAPIGININSETPAEIAVSILGEMIKIKNS